MQENDSRQSKHNPYQAPQSSLSNSSDQAPRDDELAPLGLRLAGALIDGFLSLIVTVPLMLASGYLERALDQTIGMGELLAWAAGGLAIWLALHGFLLHSRGQTIGKRLVGTQIVAVDNGQILPLPRLFGLRVLPITLIQLIPVLNLVGPLIDILFIFGQDRRCVHDMIAGTKVIMFEPQACERDPDRVTMAV